MLQTMKKSKHSSAERDKNTSNLTNDLESPIPKYEPDDGMVSVECIEAIKKIVPQIDLKNAEYETSLEELGALYQFAQTVFGSEKKADLWLNEYHSYLKNSPIKIAQTKEGLKLITEILASILYGGVA